MIVQGKLFKLFKLNYFIRQEKNMKEYVESNKKKELFSNVDGLTEHHDDHHGAIKKEDMNYIARLFKFEFFNKGENIFQYGQQGDKFYVMLQGKARALVPKRGLQNIQKLEQNNERSEKENVLKEEL